MPGSELNRNEVDKLCVVRVAVTAKSRHCSGEGGGTAECIGDFKPAITGGQEGDVREPPESTSTIPLPILTAPLLTTPALAISTRLPVPLAIRVPELTIVPLTMAVPPLRVSSIPPDAIDVARRLVPPVVAISVPPLKIVDPLTMPPEEAIN